MFALMRMKEETMTTRHLVDREIAAILDQLPAPELTTENLSELRAMSSPPPVDLAQTSTLSITERFILGPEGEPDVRVLVYRPTTARGSLPALLWIHGGGYIMGSADGEDLIVKDIVSAIGCTTVSVDYRLAPETP